MNGEMFGHAISNLILFMIEWSLSATRQTPHLGDWWVVLATTTTTTILMKSNGSTGITLLSYSLDSKWNTCLKYFHVVDYFMHE